MIAAVETIEHDCELTIALGKSRFDTEWRNKTITVAELVKRLKTPTRTQETLREFMAASNDQQSDIKDIGGYILGMLKNGRRTTHSVASRSAFALDLDYATAETVAAIHSALPDVCWLLHSTHKHSAEKPRLRLVIPTSRPMFADEYTAAARMLAKLIGIDQFDDSTYEPQRLMYWPSVSSDGEYVFEHNDAPFIDPDALLARYEDWKDSTQWPVSSRQSAAIRRSAERAGDPLEKKGIVGAFCRAFSPAKAIAEFLAEIYKPARTKGRYTLIEGSSYGGLVIYEGKWAFSNHATDAISGQLCNAFDLVRLHRYGDMDEDVREDVPVGSRPSYRAMVEWAEKIPAVRVELINIATGEAARDFADPADDGDSAPDVAAADEWKAQLDFDSNGLLKKSAANVASILASSGRFDIALNTFCERIETRMPLPWRGIDGGNIWTDTDDAQLAIWLERTFKVSWSDASVMKAVMAVSADRQYHPVREYLLGLPEWDGVARLDELLIKYLGAADTPYTRAVTRKTMVAAIARVMSPGCKFDTMLVTTGVEGIGKSTLFRALVPDQSWFSDCPPPVSSGKELPEHLRGKWLIEFAELNSFNGRDAEHVKAFLSSSVDSYRAPYGRRTLDRPRQCVFFGSTNLEQPINSSTGARRFWLVRCDSRKADIAEVAKLRDQIWAEAFVNFAVGETIWLDDPELEAAARRVQTDAIDDGGLSGQIEEWLDRPISEKYWDTPLGSPEDDFSTATMQRKWVNTRMIFIELLNGQPKDFDQRHSNKIAAALRKIEGWTTGTIKIRTGARWGRCHVSVRI